MKSNPVSTNPTFEVKQDSGYMRAELWFEQDLNVTASDDWTIKQAQAWLDRNKYYLTDDQISAVQNWIEIQAARDDIEASHPSTGPGYLGTSFIAHLWKKRARVTTMYGSGHP